MRRLLLVAVTLTLSPAFAKTAPKNPYSVDSMSLRLFNRVTNKIVPFDKPPNPYGMDMDVIVAVKVKLTGEAALVKEKPAFDLELLLDYPKREADEVGNEAEKAKQVTLAQRKLWLGDNGAAYFLFVIPYTCTSPMITAHVTGADATTNKSLDPKLGCAE